MPIAAVVITLTLLMTCVLLKFKLSGLLLQQNVFYLTCATNLSR